MGPARGRRRAAVRRGGMGRGRPGGSAPPRGRCSAPPRPGSCGGRGPKGGRSSFGPRVPPGRHSGRPRATRGALPLKRRPLLTAEHPADINTPLPKRRISPGTPQESPPPPSTHLSLRSTSLGFRLLQEEQKAALSPHLAAPCRAVPWVGAHLRSTLCATQHSTARSKAPVAVSTATNQAGGSQASSVLLTTSGSFRSVCRGRGEGPGGEPA